MFVRCMDSVTKAPEGPAAAALLLLLRLLLLLLALLVFLLILLLSLVLFFGFFGGGLFQSDLDGLCLTAAEDGQGDFVARLVVANAEVRSLAEVTSVLSILVTMSPACKPALAPHRSGVTTRMMAP